MLNRSISAAVIGVVALISGCTGKPDNAAAPEPAALTAEQDQGGDGVISVQSVDGPLDTAQTRLGTSILTPVTSAVAGTPLEALLRCTDAIVSHNILDIADSAFAQLQQSQRSGGNTSLRPDEQQLTNLLGSVAINLTQLLQALAGGGEGCVDSSASLGQIGFNDNPLVGTPFEPLGTTLGPLLARVATLVDRHDDPKAGTEPLSVERVAELLADIDYAMQLGLQRVPLEARRTPIVGGILHTVAVALTSNSAVLAAVLSHDPAAIGESLRIQLEQTLINTATQVLPVRAIESHAGQPDLIGFPIRISVANYGSLWQSSVGTAATPAQTAALDSALAAVLAPVESDLLPTVLAVLDTAQASEGSKTDPTLVPMIDALHAAIGNLFVAPEGAECSFAALPLLSGLCRSM